jgi:hypothetical protein
VDLEAPMRYVCVQGEIIKLGEIMEWVAVQNAMILGLTALWFLDISSSAISWQCWCSLNRNSANNSCCIKIIVAIDLIPINESSQMCTARSVVEFYSRQ